MAMEFRTLDVTIMSAHDLKNVNSFNKIGTYAIVSLHNHKNHYYTVTSTKQNTPIDKQGIQNPTWNFPMKFTIDEGAMQNNSLTLVFQIQSRRIIGTDKLIGEVHVPIKDILSTSTEAMKHTRIVSYQVRGPSGKPRGILTFKYKFGEKFQDQSRSMGEEPVMAYPVGMGVGSSSGYPPHMQHDYAHLMPLPYAGYPAQQPSYGYSYAPPPVVQPPPRRNKNDLRMGLGASILGGALAGMLIGDVVDGGFDGGFDGDLF